MADTKVTKMVMKVDLQCSKCYKKIKRVLCRYPREIRDQVYDQKNNMISITVVCCSPERIKEKLICKARETVESIEIVPDKKPDTKTFTDTPNKVVPSPKPPNVVVPVYPLPLLPPWPNPMYPSGIFCCCCCCYEGRPCCQGRGPMCQCSNRGFSASHCCEYFSEENPSGCSIM